MRGTEGVIAYKNLDMINKTSWYKYVKYLHQDEDELKILYYKHCFKYKAKKKYREKVCFY